MHSEKLFINSSESILLKKAKLKHDAFSLIEFSEIWQGTNQKL